MLSSDSSRPIEAYTAVAAIYFVLCFSISKSAGFVEKTSAAIIVLLLFLLAMNGVAIWLRNRFETRW